MNSQTCASCELCSLPGGEICWEDALCRVVLVQGEDGRAHPGSCRVIWHRHVAEMTDLSSNDRQHLMQVVFATEAALRQLCRPHKINLASLGNLVPHVHWHVIPRFADDSHFPAPIWATARRAAPPARGVPTPADLRRTITSLLPEVPSVPAPSP